MEYTYNYRASACPAPQEPLAALYLGASPPTPLTYDSITAGGGTASAQSLPTKWNRNAVRDELGHRYGGGYGINWGLDLHEGSGLTARVLNGQATLDGIAELKEDAGYGTLAVTDNAVNRAWLSRGSSLSKVTGDSATPLAPPDADTLWLYLGAFLVSGGNTVALDRSGVITKYQGNLLLRRTADPGEPDDTPPASLRFYTRTEGGLYLWTGEEYLRADTDTTTLVDSLTDTQDELDETRRLFRVLLLQLARGPLGASAVSHPDLQRELVRAFVEAR